MSNEHAQSPYYKVLAWLTVLTAAEIVWALPSVGIPRMALVLGLGAMALVKVTLVAMYYMHLKYEGKLLVSIVVLPLLLVIVMIAGLLPDAIGYWR